MCRACGGNESLEAQPTKSKKGRDEAEEPESYSTQCPWALHQSVPAGMQPRPNQDPHPDPDLGLSSLCLWPCTDSLHRTTVSLRLGIWAWSFAIHCTASLVLTPCLAFRVSFFLDVHLDLWGHLPWACWTYSLIAAAVWCPFDVTFCCYTWLPPRTC